MILFLEQTEESPVWSMHHKEELTLLQDIPAVNGFDEMIKLTEQGKLWQFPIDNEQGVDESDANVPFHEHIFLDHYLEKFPLVEPLQEFMTLVLNGLSKNSFLSVQEKKDIINWYLEYFNEKLDVIKEALLAEKQEEEYRNSIGGKSA
jgi:small subunit ribosomal protein S31